jgi:hypothetical protein
MPAPAIVEEDGTGKADANSYASLEWAQNYVETRLNSDEWNGATADQKAIALLMATRSIDVNMEWKGYRLTSTQALDWPRIYVPDNRFSMFHWVRDPLAPVGVYGPTYPSDAVPDRVKQATVELAADMLKSDRASEWDAQGVSSIGLGQGALDVSFTSDAAMLKKIFTPQVEAMLSQLGTPVSSRVQARVRRG